MKYTYLLFLPLMLASLACLETTITATPPTGPAKTSEPEASPQAASLEEPASGVVFEPETWSVTPETLCAIVTADQALNLRAEPNENSRIIKWLRAGEIVTITSVFQEWRGVTTKTATGYAHSAYLTETECN